MALAVIAFVSDEVNVPRFLVHRLDAERVPLAFRQLAFELWVSSKRLGSVEAVEIKVSVAIAPARPQELAAGIKWNEVVRYFHPSVGLFVQHRARLAGVSVSKGKVELVLLAVERLDPCRPVIEPAEARDVFVPGNIQPLHLAAI